VRTGRVLSAEFVNDGSPFQATWFQRLGRHRSGAQGRLLHAGRTKAFAAHFELTRGVSRVSSGFSMRFHLILQKCRRLPGTDFAVLTGNRARTGGDGTVEFAGVQTATAMYFWQAPQWQRNRLRPPEQNQRSARSVSQGQTIGLAPRMGHRTPPAL
jgi:hypothetical protein